MESTVQEITEISVNAHAAAVAWLNVYLAASQDEDRRALYRNLSLEFYDGGIQIVATDGTMLFRSWVPTEDNAAWPPLDEEPQRSVVVMDGEGFGVGFMRTLLRVAGEDGHSFDQLAITVAPHDGEATIPLGAEFMSERITLRASGQRIDLRLYEDDYPNWRAAEFGLRDAERVDGLTLSPRILGTVGKLKLVTAVDVEFFGDTKGIAFVARGMTEVRGVLMPMLRPAKPKSEALVSGNDL